MPDDPIVEYRALRERATVHSQGVISPDVTAILEVFPMLVDVAEAATQLVAECPCHNGFVGRFSTISDERASHGVIFDKPCRCAPLRAALSKLKPKGEGE